MSSKAGEMRSWHVIFEVFILRVTGSMEARSCGRNCKVRGISATNTRERLIQARDKESLSEEMCENLLDAFEFIGSLRMRHQANQIRNGEPPDNYLPPSSLSGLERGHLKDAFAVISDMQEVLENRYQIGRLI